MSSELTTTDETPLETRRPGRLLIRVLMIAGLALTLAVVAGASWRWAWTPPEGMVWKGQWVLMGSALSGEFSATGWYFVCSLAAGLVLGTVTALGWRDHELVNLLTATCAAVLAGWLMVLVGESLSPPDPRVLAKHEKDLVMLPSDLRLTGSDGSSSLQWGTPALTGFPAGTLLALGVIYTLGSPHRARHTKKAGGPTPDGRPFG